MEETFRSYVEAKLDSKETLNRYLSYFNKMNLGECTSRECLQRKALEIRNKSKWYRLTFYNYLNMLYELGEISLEDMQRLKKLAKPKQKTSFRPAASYNIQYNDIEELSSSAKPYILLLYFSGARGTEALEVRRRINEAKCEGEYCYVELNWQRGFKRSYVVFFPSWLKPELEAAPEISIHYLKKVGRRIGGLKALRKNFYQKCTEICSESICDFYQGRLRSVSARHYLDTLEKAKKCYPVLYKRLTSDTDKASIVLEVANEVRSLLQELLYKLQSDISNQI